VHGHQINASRPGGAVQAEIGWNSIDQDLKELCSDRFRETIKKVPQQDLFNYFTSKMESAIQN
jgi:hypothetical protein